MRMMFGFSFLGISVLTLLSSCGSKTTTPPPAVSVTLNPASAAAYVNQPIQFTATVRNATNSSVTWSIAGAGCTGLACGTVDTAGLYTAPATVPGSLNVTVKATSVADTSKSASASVSILALADVWTWVSGSDQPRQAGIYGTQGIPDPANTPGSRELASSWVDASGSLWLFGGGGYDSALTFGGLNDLWRYEGDLWTWIRGSHLANQPGVYGTKGVPDPSNIPGARAGSATWVDRNGAFWLFGGSQANDLWKFDPVTLEWTWVSGDVTGPRGGVYGTKGVPDPANIPGSRYSAASWLDSNGSLWLYGGLGYDWNGMRGTLADLWEFDPATLLWTWISGSDTAAWKNDGNPIANPAVYGTRGVADPANHPGSRQGAVCWVDAAGEFWLFGGVASYWNAAYDQLLNDLWKFDPQTLQWMWVSGSDELAQPGTYGTRGIPSQSNVPGARLYAISWLDPDGCFWLHGGYGHFATGQAGYLNDLWKFDPVTQEWTWVSGSNIGDQTGFFGPKGGLAPTCLPPNRIHSASWVDAEGNLWLFGGTSKFPYQSPSEMNDLWRYIR